MRTGASSRRGEGSAALLVLVVLLAGLTGCSFGKDPAPADTSSSSAVANEVRAVMRHRAKAVREGNMTGFLTSVKPARRHLVEGQQTYFLNLRELPLAKFRYVVPAETVTSVDDGRIHAVVSLRMQIEDFDTAPVESLARFTFERADDGALLIISTRDKAFEREQDIELAPWDIDRISVVEGDGVLGIFDDHSADAAYQIIDSIEDGIDEVSRLVPWSWSRNVIVYALSDTRVLSSLDDLPGGDADRLDGVAFPVAAAVGRARLASTRFMLHPRMIYRTGRVRDRLIRHELTHVALGRRDDNVPTWVSEGVAEYVSVEPTTEYERTISRMSVDAAREGIDAMPSNSNFNGNSSAANYGISWYACEFIADTYGEDALWRLLDAMHDHGGTSEQDQDDVLRQVLGIDSRELARAAGKKVLATFG